MDKRKLEPAVAPEAEMTFDDFDELLNPGPEVSEFEAIADSNFSRRSFLEGGMHFGVGAFLLSAGSLAPGKAQAASRLAFEAVAANSLDTVTVPKGYTWQPVLRWGDPIKPGVKDLDTSTRGTGQTQEQAFGDNTDGMALFTSAEGRHVIAVNNEYINAKVMFGNRSEGKPETDDDLRKSMAGHGVSIVEVVENNGKWQAVVDSSYNRRITANTEMELIGPTRGTEFTKTALDPSGSKAFGTWNNCGNGRTPWGTYLTCEENFNGYFTSSDEDVVVSPEKKRYGIGVKGWGYDWAKIDERFDISKHPNESNRFGYVVEIDALDPGSTPRKLTALGRFKHENAELVIAANGHGVVYMGDDERGEFLYRFVSKEVYSQGGDNRKLLDEGELYVAKFNGDNTGKWMHLSPSATGMSEAEIHVHTRIAASKVGATTMDRPEWVAANPTKPEVYCCLTNNKNRGVKPNAGGDETPAAGPNPREKNLYGQIVRWRPANDDHTADNFEWDLYVLAGNPDVHSDSYGGSANVTTDNMFNSPDGLAFDPSGLLWIQTDGNDSNEGEFAGMGNNQMLCGDTQTGEIKRFMVGPIGCEVTGFTYSPDRRTIFVGIQHPGGKFPDGDIPRSTIVAIMREDGTRIV